MDERGACMPVAVAPGAFNPKARLPYGLTIEHIRHAMESFTSFLGLVNRALNRKKLERLESVLMPANFSSIVGEFVGAAIPKFCPTLARNRYHNGHPDLIPAGVYRDNRIKLASQEIEIKGSRNLSGWQGHNAEDTWLMVICFDSERPVDKAEGREPKPFRFLQVVGAKVKKSDWQFAGRSPTSRRTITASITRSGYDKMLENWIYRAGDLGRVD
jgi:hypothetical protein